jgi:hypothetical protein
LTGQEQRNQQMEPIEDCAETPEEVRYYFESGHIGTVSRTTGEVFINREAEEDGGIYRDAEDGGRTRMGNTPDGGTNPHRTNG